MFQLSPEKLAAYRKRTFRIKSKYKVKHERAALDFVNERGFVFFWPVKGILLPSLWTAAAGDRPVADNHDDPGHKTWGWKDSSLGKKQWYYAKLLRRRATFVSLEIAPYFYALTPNFGEPEVDYLLQYQEGKLTVESKQVYEALLKEGPLDTISLKKAARLTTMGSETRFNKALDDLQMDMRILPVGVAEVGSWNYAFIYDLTHKHFPNLIEKAGKIGENEARYRLTTLYLASIGAFHRKDLNRLFRWTPVMIERIVSRLIEKRDAVQATLLNDSEPWYAINSLLEKP